MNYSKEGILDLSMNLSLYPPTLKLKLIPEPWLHDWIIPLVGVLDEFQAILCVYKILDIATQNSNSKYFIIVSPLLH